MRIVDLVEILEMRYPNDALVLKGKSGEEVSVHIALVEMIEEIKQIEKDGGK